MFFVISTLYFFVIYIILNYNKNKLQINVVHQKKTITGQMYFLVENIL